jgi:hypothetical protein
MPLRSLIESLAEELAAWVGEIIGEVVMRFIKRSLPERMPGGYKPWPEKYYGKSYSADYIQSFFCPKCGGKSETKRLKMNCYFYKCRECGQEWFASRKNLGIKREIESGKSERHARQVLIPVPRIKISSKPGKTPSHT